MEVTTEQECSIKCEINSNDEASESTFENITEYVSIDNCEKGIFGAETKPFDFIQDPLMESSERYDNLDQDSSIKLELPVVEELDLKEDFFMLYNCEDLIHHEELKAKKAQWNHAYYLRRKAELNQRRQANRIKQRQNSPVDSIHTEDQKKKKAESNRAYYLKRKTELNQRRQVNRVKQRQNPPTDVTHTEDQKRKKAQSNHAYYLKRKTELNQHRHANRIKQQQNSPKDLIDIKEEKSKKAEANRAYYLRRKTELNQRRQANRVKQRQNGPMVLESINEHYCGQLVHTCAFCNALHFYEEKHGSDGHFRECCHNGKTILSEDRLIKETPTFLFKYFTEKTNDAINFMENILAYNSALAFASLKANVEPHIPGPDPYIFKIRGQMLQCVLYSSLLRKFSYGQMYAIDSEEALKERMAKTEDQDCLVEVMENLQTFLIANNPYAKTFKTLAQTRKEQSARYEAKGLQVPKLKIAFTKGPDPTTVNSQTNNEIAAVVICPNTEVPSNIDFKIYPYIAATFPIPVTSPNADPMTYPLLFPYGEKGWESKLLPSNSPNEKSCITLLQYYSHRLAIRPGFSIIHSAGKLFQQYIVNAYVKVESSRLLWVKQKQRAFGMQNYKTLNDHMTTETSDCPPAKLVILPSTFIGGPRNMRRNYLDALAIVGQYGQPDYFITFACDPRWREITENVNPWEEPEHRPDLVVRVFSLKLKALLKDLQRNSVFGVVLAHIYVIEFQTTGLPRAHIWLIVQKQDGTQIDKVISAEIPENNSRLYDIIKANMVHGPCGLTNPKSACMFNGECRENYPKPFCSETIKDEGNGYVKYRRRNNGITMSVNGFDIDNRWIVPYNPELSLKYSAHINVEACASVTSVEHLFKYLCKGRDCSDLYMSDNNEIENYVNSRYISAPEAAWRLFENKMYDMSHTVYNLAINLPNEQVHSAKDAEQTAQNADTTLTTWFHLNKTNAIARQLLYTEIPKYFVFTKGKQWKERERDFQSIIGRMYVADPTDLERVSLRLLLLRVKGATCFDDLKSYEGIKYNTFYEAALAWGLLDNDDESKNCLTESISSYMPSQIRFMFSLICTFCRPTNVKELWEMFKASLIEDFTQTYDKETSINLALCDIQDNLMSHDLKCTDINLPEPDTKTAILYLDSALYNLQEEANCGQQMYKNLNAEQSQIVDEVLEAIYGNSSNKLFFVDGPGGTGKTYLYSVLLHTVRGKGDTAEAVAWTSIAAGLLKGGRTAQSMFKLPDPISKTSKSTIKRTSKEAEHLKTVKVFIWDEAAMVPKYALEVVDKLLRYITRIKEPFGGKVFVLGGDFRQVVPHGARSASVEMCLKNSALWPLLIKKYLTRNMRTNQHELTFADFLLQIGNGTIQPEPDLELSLIKIPEEYVIADCLVNEIYGTKLNCSDTPLWASMVILCPTNDACSTINEQVVNKLPGKCYDYYSVDSIECDYKSDYEHYSTEFLNSLTPSSMPPHHLQLKINAVIILLRDLSIKKGLYSGVRLIVKRLFTNFIEAEILTGQMPGNVVFLPRVILSGSSTGLPFQLKRKQFPIRLAYAITINQAQGQTFNKLGIYLPEPVCSHGQLYLALSRAKEGSNVKIKIENTKEQGYFKGKVGSFTKNIVYKEIIEL